jgi:nucleolar protein 56
LFQRNESDEIGDNTDAVQEHLKDFKRFSKIVTLKAIDPFTSSEEALENANDVSEGRLPLWSFIGSLFYLNIPN